MQAQVVLSCSWVRVQELGFCSSELIIYPKKTRLLRREVWQPRDAGRKGLPVESSGRGPHHPHPGGAWWQSLHSTWHFRQCPGCESNVPWSVGPRRGGPLGTGSGVLQGFRSPGSWGKRESRAFRAETLQHAPCLSEDRQCFPWLSLGTLLEWNWTRGVKTRQLSLGVTVSFGLYSTYFSILVLFLCLSFSSPSFLGF